MNGYICVLYIIKVNKSVDPYKDLIFNRSLPDNYRLAVEIISGGYDDKNRNEILSTYKVQI